MLHDLGLVHASKRDTGEVIHVNHRFPLSPLAIGRRSTVKRGHVETVALMKEQIGKLGLAEPGRVREQRLEHRLKVARRARDDAQHGGLCILLGHCAPASNRGMRDMMGLQ